MKEIKETPPPGKLVVVNGHLMQVYTEGTGDTAIVFMSGGGTSAPTLDFKPLWSELLDQYQIAVIEKAGYGWSDIADVSRDIDVILEESRTSLEKSGIASPYVLAAHSMSGIEAIRWAQKYPEEVTAIIGLDPAIPGSYENMVLPNIFTQNLAVFAARTGLLRFIPDVANSSAAIQSGYLSAEEVDTYQALFYRRTLTSNMQEEVKQIKENAKKVNNDPVPFETPMYFFISDGEEIDVPNWQEILFSYTEDLIYGKHLTLDAGHYIHAWEPERIGKEIDQFLKQLN
ncbi:alpha/beta fold hydrolase [Oceanobacillus chungangensis]|uniref:alpha/beta fold hydrolase n=1 Tax=Oceanobacillus chungangensis TaxID=1229152 RepID=UPI001B869ADB|nr:alpha/beta hydrolase [Oceanobacillus chungangensis]